MSSMMTGEKIRSENRKFQSTGGISQNNRSAGFRPAFCDVNTGRAELSRFSNGMPAPFHMLCGIPEEWVISRTSDGEVSVVKPSVIAGFLREGRFYTRQQAADAVRTQDDLLRA